MPMHGELINLMTKRQSEDAGGCYNDTWTGDCANGDCKCRNDAAADLDAILHRLSQPSDAMVEAETQRQFDRFMKAAAIPYHMSEARAVLAKRNEIKSSVIESWTAMLATLRETDDA